MQEKTSSQIGQVREKKVSMPEKLRVFIQSIREEAAKKQQQDATASALQATRFRWDTIRKNLNYITDTDSAEICIYQLKAAELDYNRHIRLAKEQHMYSGEETL